MNELDRQDIPLNYTTNTCEMVGVLCAKMLLLTIAYSWQQAAANGGTLPPETVEFAQRMFDAARSGDTALLSQAIDSGLPANLTNEKGLDSRPIGCHPHR